VQRCQSLHLLHRQALDTSIGGMRLQWYAGLSQPVAQRFGIDGKHLTAVKSRKCRHDQFSFQVRGHDEEKSSGDPRDFSWEKGETESEYKRGMGDDGQRQLILPPASVWCGNSSHNCGGTVATTTRPIPTS
jgi:hypothetical protein